MPMHKTLRNGRPLSINEIFRPKKYDISGGFFSPHDNEKDTVLSM